MRAKKGTISIENFRGMLRLRLPRTWYNGEKKWFSLHLPDTPENRKIAEAKIGIMHSDYIYDRFDFTLDKYRFDTAPEVQELSLLEIFEQYMEFKKHTLKHSSMKNLITVKGKLESMPESVIKSAKNIKSWLVEHSTQEQARRCLMQLKACGDWAVEQELLTANPFADLKRLKRVYDNNPDPFTREERDLIIATFEKEKPHFANLVKFLFFTGCRPSEGVALKWANVFTDYLIFCESLVEGHWENSTKTRSERKFPINPQLKLILENQPQKTETVFFSEKEKAIDLHNFSNRIWTPLIKTLSIRKRGCYHCRHTFITLCLDVGIPIQQVANWVGNSPNVILTHYAGLTRSEVPNL